MSNLRTISLCAGAGICEEGSQAFFQTAMAVDSWWRVCCSHLANHPGVQVVRGDIGDAKCREWCREQAGEVDGIVATPPCPSFSPAGARNPADARSQVFLSVLDWIEQFQPRFALIENVEGILASPYFFIALHRLRHLGYIVRVWLLDAASYGTPQHRRRVFLVAVRQGEPIPEAPPPTHGGVGLLPYRTIRDALEGMDEAAALRLGCAVLSPNRKVLMEAVPPGGNWRALPDALREIALKSIHGRRPPRRLCQRCSWDEPAETLLTGPHVATVTMALPPHVNRPFSVVEYLRLQGVRRPLHLFGSIRQRYAQVGNGVPVQLMAAVSRSVANAMAGSKSYPKVNLVVEKSVVRDTLKITGKEGGL